MKKLLSLVVVLLPVVVLADSQELGALFPLRALIGVAEPGLCRLELPEEVIGACRSDLADLRVLGHDGREIPYIVDNPEPAGHATGVSYGASPEIIDAGRSHVVRDDRVNVFRESYVLALPALPADIPAWDLVLTVGKRKFVSRFDLTALDGEGRRTPIVQSGSVFRLPAADAEKLRFSIPVRGAETLEVAIESQDVGFLDPGFSLEATRFLPVFGTSSAALEILEKRDLAAVTEVVVRRPRGLVPRRLVIATSTDTFHRRITVWDEGPGADPEPLGTGVVVRVASVSPVEILEIVLRPPRGDRLRLVVEDQDSPGLEQLAVSALMPRPVLVFSLPDGPPSATLYFGGGRAHRPHYDLAALDPRSRMPAHGESAERMLAVLDPTRSRPATLAAVERNPGYDPAPVLAFAIHPGAELDSRPYSHRRRLDIAPSTEGLARLPLDPADLAVLRSDLADLRIIDGESRQWAYLKQNAARAVFTTLRLGDHGTDNRVSHYALEVPDGPLDVNRLILEAEAPYFDRDFTLRGQIEDGDDRVLVRGRLARRAGDPRPLIVSVPTCRVIGLELEIEDGDDAPLVFHRVEARTLAPDLYIAAEAGTFELLLGFPEAEAPVYELERVRSTILAVPASVVIADDLEANPAFNASSRILGDTVQKLILWAVLGLAVIVLSVLTLRAARQEGED